MNSKSLQKVFVGSALPIPDSRLSLSRPLRTAGATAMAMLAFMCVFFTHTTFAGGERGIVPEPAGYDDNHAVMDILARAGVTGGIPETSTVKATVWPGGNIQAAIDNGGPGVVLLKSGTHEVWDPIYMKKGVILRGEHRNNVRLSVLFRSTWKRFAIEFGSGCTFAGLEDLTVAYEAVSQGPIDRGQLDSGGLYAAAYENNPHGINDLYVGLVKIASENNWVDSVDLRNSGTDPILVSGWRNTVRNCYIDRCYNKGSGGNGYFDLRGGRNLITENWIRRLRHFAIQQGAQYNVVNANTIEVDINFHNGDNGQNLVEHNEIYRSSWHLWTCFGTGGAQYGHQPPGGYNIIFRNTTWDYAQDYSPASNWNTSYTFWTYGQPSATGWAVPKWGKYYSVKYLPAPWSAGHINGNGSGFSNEDDWTWTVKAGGNDVWWRADDFYYVWQTLHGDGEIQIEVVAQPNTDEWAKAGLMIREHLDADSKHAMVCVTPGNGTSFQYRNATGGESAGITPEDGQTAPAKLRLLRRGDTLTGFVWRDNDWQLVGETTLSMWTQAHIGFFVSSHSSDQAEVEFYRAVVPIGISLEKDELTTGESVDVDFWQAPGNATDWIGIFREEDEPGSVESRAWSYLNGEQEADEVIRSGTVGVNEGPGWPLPPGSYYAVLLADDGYNEVTERIPFTVHFDSNEGEPPAPPPAAAILIDSDQNNGSFEAVGGAPVTSTAHHWDTDPDGDVDNWTLWDASSGGPATTSNDSGVTISDNASDRACVGFLQPGNAVYNLTSHHIAEGDTFTSSWKWVHAGRGSLKGQLAYQNGATVVPIAGTEVGGNTVRTFWRTWTVPAGHPAIGHPVALTLSTTSNFPEVDEVVLYVTSPTLDADEDGMPDDWEFARFGDASQDGTADADGDGTDNLAEFLLGLDPMRGDSRFALSMQSSEDEGTTSLVWTGKAGLTFIIERSETLAEDSWTPIHQVDATEDGQLSFTDNLSSLNGRAFYRVRLNR